MDSTNRRDLYDSEPPPPARAYAWLIHAYTACGAALACFALTAAMANDFRTAFVLLWIAMFIDCTDGTLARRARVKESVPEFDGARLDDIVDYLNYTFVPIVIAYTAGLLPAGILGAAATALPLLASAYGFCRTDAKTDDHLFTGFPSYWNIAVLYFFLLQTSPTTNALFLLAFAALVFVPIGYAYPSRNPTGRKLTIGLGLIWSALLLHLTLLLPAVDTNVAALSLFFPLYYFGLSFYLDWRRRQH